MLLFSSYIPPDRAGTSRRQEYLGPRAMSLKDMHNGLTCPSVCFKLDCGMTVTRSTERPSSQHGFWSKHLVQSFDGF